MKTKKAFLLLAVLSITAAAFWPSLFNGFLKNDDPTHLLENVTLRALTWHNLYAMFSSIVNVTYIPLTTLSFAVEYHFFGYEPFVYHLNNLLLHLAVTALVFGFFRRLGLSETAAAIGALVFGIHPLRVESVAWVTERKDVLYAFFYMLAVNWYWDYAKTDKGRFFVLSILSAGLSILAKPMALSLPLVLLLCDWWMGRKWEKKIFFEKIPFFLAVVPVALVTYLWNARNPVQHAGEAVLLWVWCFIFYIRKFIFPTDLIIFYQFPRPFTLSNPEYLFSFLAFCVLGFGLWYFRKQRLFIFSVLFYFLSIFFLLRFDDVENINPVSDRFMYLPSVGFCALLGAGFTRLFERGRTRGISVAILAVLVLFMFISTIRQCLAWRDGAGLWSAVLNRSPELVLAYVHRGAEYHERGDLARAERDYLTAVSIADDAYARSNLAMIYKQQKRYEDALREYNRAVALKPDYWGWYFDRGNLHRELGRYDLAISDYSQTLRRLPAYSEAYGNRGLSFFLAGRDDLAMRDLDLAVRFDPRNVNAINNRAVLFVKQGRFDKAIADFSLSIKLDPQNPSVYFNRGLAYQDTYQYNLALRDFNEALRVDPDHRPAALMKREIETKARP